jgi:hypothetical protein
MRTQPNDGNGSTNSLLQSYYGDVLQETLHRTLVGSERLFLCSGELACHADAWGPRTLVDALLRWREVAVRELAGERPKLTTDHMACIGEAHDKFQTLRTLGFLEWGRFTEFYKAFPHSLFADLARVQLSGEFSEGQRVPELLALSQALSLFENAYFQKVLVFKPRISSDHLGVSDPVFRLTVRRANLADPEIDSVFFTPKFNIKSFLLDCMNAFFPHIEQFLDLSEVVLHVKILRMILMMFEYGLWTIEEVGELVSRVYVITSRLANMETFFEERLPEPEIAEFLDAGQPEEEDAKCGAECPFSIGQKRAKNIIQARILVGKILHHFVAMHMDHEVEISIGQMNIALAPGVVGPLKPRPERTIDPNSVFVVERMRKKKLYTYFSYILVNYLMGPVHEFVPRLQRVYWAKLTDINQSLLAHVSNMRADFFLNSLANFGVSNMSYYMLGPDNPYAAEATARFTELRRFAQTSIEADGFEKGEVPDSFFQWLSNFVAQTTALFAGSRSAEEVCARQLAFSLAKVDHLLLSLLDLVTPKGETDLEPRLARAVEECFDFLVLMCKENLQCVNSFFSYFILKHFTKFFDKNTLATTYLVMQLLRNRQCAQLLAAHGKVKAFLERRLNQLAEDLLQRMNRREDSAGPQDWVNFGAVGPVIFVCKLVKSVIKDRDEVQLNVSTRFAKVVLGKLNQIFELLRRADRVDQSLDARFDRLNRLEDLVRESRRIEQAGQSQRMYLGLVALEHLTGLFSTATRNFFYPEIQQRVAQLFGRGDSDHRLGAYFHLLTSQVGLKIFRKILKIYTNFVVFPENCSLSPDFQGSLYQAYLAQPDGIQAIADDICEFGRALKPTLTNGMAPPAELQLKLLFKGFLPLVFKFVTGFLAAYTDQEFRASDLKTQSVLAGCITQVRDMVCGLLNSVNLRKGPSELNADREAQINTFLANINSQDHRFVPQATMTSKTDALKATAFAALTAVVEAYRFRPHDLSRIASFYKFSETESEKRLLDRMTANLSSHLKFRTEFKLTEASELLKFGKAIVLKRTWEPAVPEFLYSSTSCRPYNFSLVHTLEGTEDPTEQAFSRPAHHSKQTRYAVEFYKQRYWKLKSDLLDDLSRNQFMRILKSPDPVYQTSKIFVDYFAAELRRYTESFELSKTVRFVLSDKFQTLFSLADNLFRNSPGYREYFLDYVSQEEDRATLQRLCVLRHVLFDLVAYRTFRNDAWNTLFCAFFLVSCFIQTLCENNCVPFKELMLTTPLAADPKAPLVARYQGASLLSAYNSSVQAVILRSEVHHRDKLEIDVNDRADYCHLYARAIEEISEYMNGGSVTPPPIYKTRVDIWWGILFRRETNLDSPFYQVKLNVVMYLNALVESSDRQAIEFLSNKIYARDLLRHCVSMLRPLFSREKLQRKGQICKGCAQAAETKGVCQLCFGRSDFTTEKLIALYKTQKSGFAGHPIIDIVFAVYRFMNKLEEYDTRYSHFIAELNHLIEEAAEGQASRRTWLEIDELGTDGNDITHEEINCWAFMNQIVDEIEVVVDVKQKDGSTRRELVNYQFKKLPVCFFDSEALQEAFWEEAPHGSLEEKHEAFINSFKTSYIRLKSEQGVYQVLGRCSFLASDRAFDWYLIPLYLIVIALNVLCLVFFNKETMGFDSPDYGDAGQVVTALTIADAALAFICLGLWLAFKSPTEFRLQRQAFNLAYGAHTHWRVDTWLYYYVYSALLCNEYFVCFGLHVLLSLLGFWSPFFYTLMLFLAIKFAAVLKGVVLAILSNLKRLFWTLVIIVIILNFFALVVTEWFNGHMVDDASTGCDSYFACFMNTVNMGVVQDGGVTSYLRLNGDIRDPTYRGLFFVRVVAFILVNLFLLGMFFGIITDAFGDYVKRLTAKETDRESRCFTCGISSATFERYGIDFDDHVGLHFVFKYLYYLIYLHKLDQSSYSGVDYQVASALKGSNKTAFLPRFQAMELKKMDAVVNEEEEKGEVKN